MSRRSVRDLLSQAPIPVSTSISVLDRSKVLQKCQGASKVCDCARWKRPGAVLCLVFGFVGVSVSVSVSVSVGVSVSVFLPVLKTSMKRL